jgi:hypothetical protein
MTWRPLQRTHAILPGEIVRAGSEETPEQAFRAMIDSVRRIDLDRPRCLLDIDGTYTTTSATYEDAITGLVIRTSDDIATPTAIGAAWQIRLDARLEQCDVLVEIYNTSGVLVQDLTVTNASSTYAIESSAETIALASDTTYRVDVSIRRTEIATGTLTHLRLVEQSI